jgi:hypothetical protein
LATPAFSTALSFYDGYRAKDLPANLLQAQRDYFGAHTFRVKPEYANETYKEGQDIHVNWTGRGGNISASVSPMYASLKVQKLTFLVDLQCLSVSCKSFAARAKPCFGLPFKKLINVQSKIAHIQNE